MAELKVEVVEIKEVMKHENADRLDICRVFGYDVITGKEFYKAGDCAVYFPVDSLLPQQLMHCIFEDTNMTPVGRIRAARIRGVVSQGLLVDIPKIKKYYFKDEAEARGKVSWSVGMDLTSALGVTKHEPKPPGHMKVNRTIRRAESPFFRKYTSIQHLKKYDKCFDTGDPVWITEKIHGTNFRAGWVPTVARSAVDRFRVKLSKSKFALLRKLSLPEYTFVFGSHNVQIGNKCRDRNMHHSTGKTNVYEQCVVANDLKKKIPLGMVFYGEIFGPGIQKGYGYGLEDGAMDVRFFDVMHAATGKYVSFGDAIIYILCADQQVVPCHQGFYSKVNINHDLNTKRQKSYLDGKTDAEGLVIRSYSEDTFLGGRKIMKWISDAYLLKKNMTEYK